MSNEKKGFTDLPLKKKGTSDKKNAVENITTEAALKRLVSNTVETANFHCRMMYDGKMPAGSIIIGCGDCSYAVEIPPEELWHFIRQYENILLDTWKHKLTDKWNQPGISFVPEEAEIGQPI
jgi:hypothetical protein